MHKGPELGNMWWEERRDEEEKRHGCAKGMYICIFKFGTSLAVPGFFLLLASWRVAYSFGLVVYYHKGLLKESLTGIWIAKCLGTLKNGSCSWCRCSIKKKSVEARGKKILGRGWDGSWQGRKHKPRVVEGKAS